MVKIYYVDSENVGDDWIDLMASTEADAKFYVFYTQRSPRITYDNAIKLLNSDRNFEFIHCNGGNNALDFQLVTFLGYRLSIEPDSDIYIVSKDTGFDAVVSFWKSRNVSIQRIKGVAQPEPASEPIIEEAIAPIIDNSVCDTDDNINHVIVDNIISCVGKGQLPTIHLFLVHFYGTDNGLALYKKVTSTDYTPTISKYDSHTKFTILCSYINQFCPCGLAVDASVIDYLYSIRTNTKAFQQNLTKKFGKKNGPKYYKMFKPFIKSLAKI